MHRTTILLPPDLRAKANHYAKELGISLGELIRSSLETRCATKQLKSDPFFADKNFYSGITPADLSSQHDNYLYTDSK